MPQVVASKFRILVLAAAAIAGLAGMVASPARADEFSERVNRPFQSVQSDRHSEVILIPLLAKLTDPPSAVAKANDAAMLPASAAAFKAAAEWAQAEPQKAFLAALPQITGEEDPKKAFAFAQLYGIEGVDPEHIVLKAYTDLGDPPLLTMANHLYLPMMDRAESLAHVEATRLASEGKTQEAVDLLWRWVHFSRSMADRQFFAEVSWALKAMTLGVMRIRDVVYLDSRLDRPLLTPEYLSRDVVAKRLQDRGGLLAIEQIDFPRGDGIACEQLIKRVFRPRGAPDTAVFSPILAKVAADKRPLRLFSETARWDSIAKLHADQLETEKAMLAGIMGDWQVRWKLRPSDPMLKLKQDWDKMDKIRGAIVAVTVDNLAPLFELRRRLLIELGGTRTALATQAYVLGQKVNPPALSSLSPIYIPRGREKDNTDPLSTKGLPYQYFVPVRDAVKNEINPATFHEMEIFPLGYQAFSKKLDASHFVIYSVGPDGAPQGAQKLTQLVEDDKGDYLIWPPVISMLREQLQATGIIK